MAERKYALVGTSCVGKTSLLEAVERSYTHEQVMVVPEIAREYFGSHPEIRDEDRLAVQTQGTLQQLILEREKVAHTSNAKILLCDRSVLDAVVYTLSTGDTEGARTLYERVLGWLPTYDVFLLLDIEGVPFEEDSVRKGDAAARITVHDTFRTFFENSDLPYEFISGSLESRIGRVREILDS